ncbi:MAG: pentapeptide repeat-containing protein, partial [Marmoricola sp.]
LLWYLADARTRPAAAALHPELDGLRERVQRATLAPDRADVTMLQSRVDPLLGEVSVLVRAGTDGADLRGADLLGQDVRGRGLQGANLRGALLIGADLRGVDLALADVLGADLRGSHVHGADLATALFLTQFQVNAARGDTSTLLPDVIATPTHWA